MKKTWVAATATVLVTAGLLAAWTTSRTATSPPAESAQQASVAVVAAVRRDMAKTMTVTAELVPYQEVEVMAKVAGYVQKVLVDVGDRVRQGQVLARFASDTLRAEVAQAQAALAEAEANAADAANNAARARTLQQTGAMSASQINQYITGEKTAQARVEAARALLQAQNVRLNQSAVKAPDEGIISARAATVGSVVGNGTELFRLIRRGRLEWRAEVTSTELARVTPGTLAIVTAASGARLEGRVRMIGPTVDPQSRLALVYVDVNPLPGAAAGSARAGMFARGEFELGAVPTLTGPQQAVVVREGFHYVFRVNPDSRVAQVKVQIGRVAGDRLQVLSGLAPEARIVASGGGFLNDGDLVRVVDGPATAGAAAAPASAASAGGRRK